MSDQPDTYFRDLCQHLGFDLLAMDLELRVCFCNASAAARLGRSAEEMVGQPFLELFSDRERDRVRRLFDETIRLGSSGEIEVKQIDEHGRRTTFVVVASPVKDGAGACIGASACMRDISQRKRLSQELARSRRMAALGNMAAGVAHHFNNILGGMLTSIDYVLPSDSPRELRRTLRLLAQAIGRATRITKQLAAFAESENERGEWAELGQAVTAFVDQIRPEAQRRGIELKTEIEEVESRPLEAHRLTSVLESLVENAFDAMGVGGVLTLELREEGDQAAIKIRDTGCGMPEEVLDRVFEPFFTTKGELAGGERDNIGLGLAVVHGLVAEMGGRIQLSSQVGRGSEVVVRLPLVRPDDRSEASH